MFQVRVPATIANVGPGFDSFGMAVSLYNTFTFKPAAKNSMEGPVPEGVSKNPDENLVFRAMNYFYTQTGHLPCGVTLSMDAQIPMARGLGSSSSAIVAGLTAANLISGDPLKKEDLLQLAARIEGHPDNVAPALMGGLVLCDEVANRHITAHPLPYPRDWRVAVVIPPYTVKTEDARKVLPKTPALEDAVFNLRKSSLMTYALLVGDEDAFARSLDDRLHQPFRGKLIREWESVRDMAAECGAFGAAISGSGPTMAVFYHKRIQSEVMAGLDDVAEIGDIPPDVRKVSLDLSGAIPLV